MMKNLFRTALLAMGLIFGVSQAAHAQMFLLGLGTGLILGSGGDTTVAGSGGPSVIYVAPRVSERVEDPLGIKMTVVTIWPGNRYVRGNSSRGEHLRSKGNLSLRQIFSYNWSESLRKEAEKYTILRIVRAIDGQCVRCAAIWFSYIENSKVIPLSRLPKLAKK
jgi:hypothetical protein